MSAYYTGLLVVTLLCMGLMACIAGSNRAFTKDTRHAFIATFILIATASFLEWLDLYLAASFPDHTTMLTFIKALELAIAPFIPIVCAIIFKDECSGTYDKAFLGLIAAHALFELGGAFVGGVTFDLGERGQFLQTPLYWVYVVVITACEVFLAVKTIKFSRAYQNRSLSTLLGLVVLLVGCACIQATFPEVKITWFSVALTSVFFYIYYNELITKVDPLTKVLNRLTFDNDIAATSERAVLILLDVDKFKAINDRYGHPYGDACLKAVASQITETFRGSGLCFRYGGDEFAVLLTKNTGSVQELSASFIAGMDRRRAADPRLPHVSLGYAPYNPGTDSIEGAIVRADEALYCAKAEARTGEKTRVDETA